MIPAVTTNPRLAQAVKILTPHLSVRDQGFELTTENVKIIISENIPGDGQ